MTEDEFKDWIMEMRSDTVKMWLRGQIDDSTLNYCMFSGRKLEGLRQVGHNSTGSGTRCPLDNGSIICACPKDHEA